MSKKDKYRQPGSSDFLDYVEGKLSDRERNALERQFEKDPFDAEAAEGYLQVTRQEAEEDLGLTGNRIRRRINRGKRIAWYSAAAAIASILVVSTIFFNVDNPSSTTHDRAFELSKAAEEAPVPSGKGQLTETSGPDDMEKAETMQQPSVTEMKKEEESSTTIGRAERERRRDEKAAPAPQIATGGIIAEEEITMDAEQDQIADEVEIDIMEEEHLFYFSDDQDDGMGVPNLPETADNKATSRMAAAKREGLAPTQNNMARVRGVVISSEDSSPLPGATVVLKGTQSGAITDTEGRFEIMTRETGESTLVASYIGMEEEEYEVSYDKSMEIVMEPSDVSLDEVVVIGYGVKQKNETGSVSRVTLEDQPTGNYKPAEPEGGMTNYKSYIDTHQQYPAEEQNTGRAVVVLRFFISPAGRPNSIEVVKSPSEAFSAEAIRLLNAGPDWIPAENNGVYVDDEVKLRITFREKQNQ